MLELPVWNVGDAGKIMLQSSTRLERKTFRKMKKTIV